MNMIETSKSAARHFSFGILVCAIFLSSWKTANGQVNDLRVNDEASNSEQVIGRSFHELPVASEFTSFSEEPEASMLAANAGSSMTRNPFAAAASPNIRKSSSLDLPAIISRLATSTIIVLAVCVGGLILYRKIRFNGSLLSRVDSSSTNSPTIQVEARLRLSANRSLEIVNADNMRLVIVSDSVGVKSVLPMTGNLAEGTSFAEQINQYQARADRKANGRVADFLLHPDGDALAGGR